MSDLPHLAVAKTPMKILTIIDNQFYLSGVNAYWKSMEEAFFSLNQKVFTLVLDDGSSFWNSQYYDTLKGPVFRLDTRGATESVLNNAKTVFQKVTPDIIFHHYSDLGFDISRSLQPEINNYGWKDVYICHSDDPDHYNRIEKQKLHLHHIVCVSETCRRHIIQKHHLLPARTSLIEYFFSLNMEAAANPKTRTSDLRYIDKAIILYAGRLESHQKRAEDLGAFVSSLRDAGIPFLLNIAGTGSMEKRLRHALRDETELGHVIFHGYLAEAPLLSLMSQSNIYISFSEFEGISTSLIQAMHFGLIPVLSRIDSGTDFLSDKKNAFFFNVGNTEQAACVIRNLLDGKNSYPMIRENVLNTVRKRFNKEQSIHGLSILLGQLQRNDIDSSN
jgi:glycosyltransferase involved in cell wall biosynthesis